MIVATVRMLEGRTPIFLEFLKRDVILGGWRRRLRRAVSAAGLPHGLIARCALENASRRFGRN